MSGNTPEEWQQVSALIEKECADVEACVVLGPGIGREPYTKNLVRDVLNYVHAHRLCWMRMD